ncbi:MAG: hypothetical protein IPM59_15385 [Chloracidobacterium sp.]|nr:hypothetical protein [Chloracidobacterium sp.]
MDVPKLVRRVLAGVEREFAVEFDVLKGLVSGLSRGFRTSADSKEFDLVTIGSIGRR